MIVYAAIIKKRGRVGNGEKGMNRSDAENAEILVAKDRKSRCMGDNNP